MPAEPAPVDDNFRIGNIYSLQASVHCAEQQTGQLLYHAGHHGRLEYPVLF